MKLYDLINRFGIEAIPIVAQIGTPVMSDADIFFVDSGATNAADANDASVHGSSWKVPFATLNYAISRCTDGQGDFILVAPGHTETIEDTGSASGITTDELVIDKDGITILGVGNDALRPTFTFGTATDAACVITGAQNVTIKNLIFVGDLEDLANLITVDGTSDGLLVEGCEFRDGGSSKETIHQINLATGADRVTIRNCRFFTTTGGSSTLSNLEVATTVDRLTVTDCWFLGDVNTDGMIDGSGGAGSLHYIQNNFFDNIDSATGKVLVLHGSTTGVVTGNVAHGANDGVNPFTIAGVVPRDNWYTNAEGARAALQGTTDDS